MIESDTELKFAADRVKNAIFELNCSLALANEYGLMVIIDESHRSQTIGKRFELPHFSAEVLKPLT